MSASSAPVARRALLAFARAQLVAGGSSAAVPAAAATAMVRRATTTTTPARAFFFSTAATSSSPSPLLPLIAARSAAAARPTLPLRRRALLHTTSAPRRAAAAPEPQPASTKQTTPWGQKSPLSFNSMVAGLALFLGIVAVAQSTADKRVGDMMQKSQQVAGKAAVGGPFRLIDTSGKTFTNRDLLGEFALLYFGFTHCPDICPDELEKVAEAVDEVERTTGAKIVPVFISVDPKRDTPQRVATYVREFHPRMLGLTGSEPAVTDAAKAYRVYFSRTDTGGQFSDGGADSASSNDDDYLVDHSIITYLIDPAGEFVTFYGKNFTAEQLAESIGGHVMAWGEKDERYLSRLACKMPEAGAAGKKEGAAAAKKAA